MPDCKDEFVKFILKDESLQSGEDRIKHLHFQLQIQIELKIFFINGKRGCNPVKSV